MKNIFFFLLYLTLWLLEFIAATIYWLPVRIVWGKSTYDYIMEHENLRDWLKNLD